MAGDQVSVGTTVVEPAALQYNTYRAALVVRNISTGTQIIYGDNGKGTGLTSSNAGIQLKPGDVLNLTRPNFTFELADKWSFVADGASGNLTYFQTISNLKASDYMKLFTSGIIPLEEPPVSLKVV